jgi:hypothetical protein
MCCSGKALSNRRLLDRPTGLPYYHALIACGGNATRQDVGQKVTANNVVGSPVIEDKGRTASFAGIACG